MKPTKITIMTWNIFTDICMKDTAMITGSIMNTVIRNIMNIITERNIIMFMSIVMERSLMRITMNTEE